MNEDPGENFLARWSRRKRQPQATGETARRPGARLDDEGNAIVESEARKPGTSQAGKRDASKHEAGEDVTEADASAAADGQAGEEGARPRDFSDVDFEKLDFESDYTTFMEKDVPDDVRNLALRKLWASNPVLTFMDGLDDYCEDYTDAAVCMPLGTMKTAYKFGRGFLNDEEVAEWEALGKPEEPSDAQTADTEVENSDAETKPGAEPADENAVAEAEMSGPQSNGEGVEVSDIQSSEVQQADGVDGQDSQALATANANDSVTIPATNSSRS